jgi:hypothetical protein
MEGAARTGRPGGPKLFLKKAFLEKGFLEKHDARPIALHPILKIRTE